MKLVIDDVTFNYKEIFSRYGDISAIPGKAISRLDVTNADILIVRSRTKITRELLEGTAVKFVGSTVSGTDHVDLAYLQQAGIHFADAKGSNANAVAEYVIWNIVRASLSQGLAQDIDYTSQTLGIVGVGCVGALVAQKAKQLGMKTLLNDPPRQWAEGATDFVSLDEVLERSDIITFHTPLETSGEFATYHLLAEHNFRFVKPDAMIINAARGGVIDELVWLNHKGVKIVDCWEHEPNINRALRSEAMLATPHIAGHSIDAKLMGSVMIDAQLATHLGMPHLNYSVGDIPQIETHHESLFTKINAMYDFKKDEVGVEEGNFEAYRRHYPKRYEWHNYGFTL